MRLAFKAAGLGEALQSVGDGGKAIKYLAGEDSYADRERHPLPTLILLDLNLPVMTGLEVMEWMRNQPQFQDLPVVIFTSSEAAEDEDKAKGLGAKAFIRKPNSGQAFRTVAKELKEKWFA